MKEIPLTKGKAAIVDDEDYGGLILHKWFARKRDNLFYAARSECLNGAQREIQMHREILGLQYKDGKLCDHKNCNGLDNRRNNLRLATSSLNGHNHRMFSTNTSGFRGVTWHKQTKKWQARICVKGVEIYCGTHNTIKSAALAYDRSAEKYFGESARLNFPELRDAALEFLLSEEHINCKPYLAPSTRWNKESQSGE